ncbi:uncharacterized protein LOC118192560 [Stegodyphus dumicola]|uniref:uncharacterized protein LOC118192560 n=1 Tax=Stegodyphus dumicola TaxID=202533 RepID=UPI0015AF0167|nr:uncharacterized protein LOC118192560 [Stegodyphus dumicola]
MPMKDSELLGESRNLAEKRLNQVWERLGRDSNLQRLYSEFMQEYKDLKHMELAEGSESITDSYYLPHHGVYRPDKSSTRLRVVFNASTATTSGLSLNDILLKGRIPQQELFSIMVRFRKHRYAFTADVQKMYRQILVHPPQRDLLRILWKDSVDAPVQTYKLNTVTYGTSNAPYLATRALKQLAIDESQNLPLASSVALTDFYVDDILSGESSLEKARILQSQLIDLLKLGKMELHKWRANHPDLLVSENKVTAHSEYTFEEQQESSSSVKTLGVLWNPQTDCFLFAMTIPHSNSYSKRDVLSLISKMFDPLGLIGPVVTKAKIFMQRLWLAKLDWNDTLPDSMAKEWINFVSTLSELSNLKIPRFVFQENHIVLHGFADASSSAYGAAIYVQALPVSGLPTVRLLCSKSRVAPIKTLSIPRLELSGCLLLSRLMDKVISSLNVKVEKVILWSDSTISLAWIRKSPHLLKTFVSNRVALIQELTGSYQWKYVPSECNPADVISRGLDANDILTCDIWWNGPDLLREDMHYPEQPLEPTTDNDYVKELKCSSESLRIRKGFQGLYP